MIRIFKLKYPKIIILILMIVFSYFLFSNNAIASYISKIGDFGYFGIFLGGILFSLGFTSPIAVGLFLTINPVNIYAAALLGGAGALISDLLIFKFIKISFEDEFEKLRRNKAIYRIERLINNSLGKRIKVYIMYIFSGIIIASPLPDEMGVIMLAGLTKIKPQILAISSFILNTLGIYIILLI